MEPMANRILVVDDNEVNLSLIAKILGLEGYQVMTACSGDEAIQSVMHQMPDLAVLDIRMPGMDGFDLCRKLRRPPFNASWPILMLTAMNPEIEKLEALEAGANDIWSKPFNMDLFRKRIGELLTSSQSSTNK
jgi:CheY-like chemotaxis protein